MLHLQKFISEHKDWKSLLQSAPYFIEIKEDENYILLKYNQVKSDFYNPIVRECRGIILTADTFEAVCVPFFKFGNYGEGYADKIDWSSARVQEKVDGSLIKVWHHNKKWHISTNGMIDASKAMLSNDLEIFKSFRDLFNRACMKYDFALCGSRDLNPNYTYMFELVSPYNRVVVPYKEIDIRHIGTRDNTTLQELEIDIGIPKPKSYSLKSLDDCIKACDAMGYDEEGYVVVDKNWNRVKIKSPAYVAVHHMANNGCINKERIVDLIKTGEDGEFLNYYPEYTKDFENIKSAIKKFVSDTDVAYYSDLTTMEFNNRKEVALYIQEKLNYCPPVFFALYDKKVDSAKEWLYNQSSDKILKWIGDK